MIFLVRSTIRPGSIDHPEWPALLEQERVVGRRLYEDGKIRHIWRVPGRYSALTLYDVDSTEELDKLLWSLPIWRFMDIEVEPLAEHYYDNPDASRFEDVKHA